MNNFLLILGSLLVGILAALVVVPMVIDWNSYRGVFEEEATRLMGRDVRVGGGVNLRILPVPYVRFEKLRIADTNSTGGDPLFRADSVTMQLSIAPLLKGVLEARSVELKRPLLRLAVDAEGRGNWRSLALKPGSLPFVPADVALQSVGIEDGKLVIAGAGAKNLAEIDAIAGELSADSFEGPYRFKGTATVGAAPREIRLSTAKPEPDGGVRVRANVHIPASETNYAFDGRIVDLSGRPRLDGDVTAKLSLLTQGQKKPAGDPDADTLDFKAKFSGDLKSGELSGIELSRDDPADAQLVTGSAQIAWNSTVKVDMALAARTFNLDRLAPGVHGLDPLETARAALAVALSGLPAEAETMATYTAERVMLHGEALSGVTVAIARHGGDIEVRTLKATLPGTSRLLASGILTLDQKQPSFTGPVSLRGANLSRMLAWSRKAAAPALPSPSAIASAPGDAVPPRYDGPFAVEGQLAMNGARFELTKASAELSGHSIAGELRLALEGRRSVGLVLDGERIEAAAIWPGGFNPADLRAYLTNALPASDATRAAAKPSGTGFFGFDPETTDLSVQVRAGELQMTPALNLKAVEASFAVKRGRLAVPRLRFATEEGLAVDIDGDITGLATAPASALPTASDRRGTVRFIVDAVTPQAVSALVSAIDWPISGRPSDATIASIAALGPLHLAGTTGLGEKGPRGLDLTIDGTVDTGRVTARTHLDAGLHAWAVAPLEFSATIETADTARWLALAGFSAPASTTSSTARPGRIVLTTSGTPRSGVATFAELTTERMTLVSQGTATVSPGLEVSFEGTSTVDARDATDALALSGLAIGQGPSDLGFSGTVRLSTGGQGLTLATSDGRLGAPGASSGITGSVSLTPATSGTPAVRELAGTLGLDQASLPELLAAVSDRRQQAASGARWPDQQLKLPTGLAGRVGLTLGRLVVEGPVAARNVTATLVFKPDAVRVEGLSGAALGGALKSTFDLASSAGGTALSGTLTLENASLAAVTPQAQVPLALSATFKSQGFSASALVAGLTGSGEATLGGGVIKGVAPSALASLVDTVLASKEAVTGDALGDALRQGLADSHLAVGAQKVPLTIAFGTLKVPPFVVRAPEGRSTVEGALDFSTLKYALDWRIEAQSKPSPSGAVKPPLSAVRLTSEGAVAALPATDAKLVLGAFEQEIVVRKLEHDAEELERLRRLDEERRKQQESERIRKDEAERARAAEAAAVAAAKAAAAGLPPPPTPQAADPPYGAQMPDSSPVNDGPAPNGTANAPPPAAQGTPVAPNATAEKTPVPAPAPAVRRRTQAPPQATGIPPPFGNSF